LTLIVLPRDLNRPAIERSDDAAEGEEDEEEWDWSFQRLQMPTPGRQRVGTLLLSGDVRLFPADGQHRARAARDAIHADHELAREEVPVVLVPYESPARVQQLFSDLNLNAKPVSKTVGYDMEHRDPLAILAKQLEEDVDLFRGRVNRRSNSLPRSSTNVISLNTLVMATRTLVGAYAQRDGIEVGQGAIEKWLSTNEVQKTISAKLADTMNVIVDCFRAEWQPVLEGSEVAGVVRDNYVFPHGLGWQALSEAAAALIVEHGDDWERRFRRGVGSLDWARTAPVWRGSAVLYDENGKDRVNNTGPGVRGVARSVFAAAEQGEGE
jgi:DGQHR domain-containing protein